jgi:uncharacterized protein YeaO (DUF488 family)
MVFVVKRVYDPPAVEDGFRVLVDRLWPRGLSKEKAHIDVWLKEVAPSTELRRWFHHEAPLFDEFTARYEAELDANPGPVDKLRELGRTHPVVTLLVGARDPELNQGVALERYLEHHPQ